MNFTSHERPSSTYLGAKQGSWINIVARGQIIKESTSNRHPRHPSHPVILALLAQEMIKRQVKFIEVSERTPKSLEPQRKAAMVSVRLNRDKREAY